MPMKNLNIILMLAIVQLCSCSNPTDRQSIPISKASIFPTKSQKVDNSVAFIYDYNPERLKLEWTACKIAKSSGDQLLDALNAFIDKNKEKGICKSLRIQKIEDNMQQLVISFSEKPVFKNKKEEKIFLTALDMTISRNSEQEDFEISFL